jgi:hypothetical protein
LRVGDHSIASPMQDKYGTTNRFYLGEIIEPFLDEPRRETGHQVPHDVLDARERGHEDHASRVEEAYLLVALCNRTCLNVLLVLIRYCVRI